MVPERTERVLDGELRHEITEKRGLGVQGDA